MAKYIAIPNARLVFIPTIMLTMIVIKTNDINKAQNLWQYDILIPLAYLSDI